MIRYLTNIISHFAAIVFSAMPIIAASTAQADQADQILFESLSQARGCETVLNDTISEGTRCLFERGLNFALGRGTELADEYGKEAFGEYFQVVGSLRYSKGPLGAQLQGDLDVVVPLVSSEPISGESALGSALFFQQGITRWWDTYGSLRNDMRQGLVYRFPVSEKSDSDILGISILHLFNAEQRHEVLVHGFDYAGKWGERLIPLL